MSKALYRKYRSKRLSEIVGQEHVTSLLERALEKNSTGHAYLLTGPRGTGKTSIARILAHEITGLTYSDEVDHLDIIEIDAASNNGVDDVRDLREKALVAPSRAPKKIYIIDEVHMLSKAAFNALLKILEEPPMHVVFILATTDFEKVPITVVSRTQRFHFHLIDEAKIAGHLAYIAKEENITITKDALRLIAERGGGSFRDSISLLDQLRHSHSGEITNEAVEHALGLAPSTELEVLLTALERADATGIVSTLQAIEKRGVSAPTLATQLSQAIRRRIAQQPHLVHFLEGLSQVPRTSHPEITLLVTLLERAAASSVPAAAVQPTQAPVRTQAAASPKPPVVVAPVPTQPAPPARTKPAISSATVAQKKPAESIERAALPVSNIEFVPENFDWQKIIDYAAEHKDKFIGVHSLLAKCSPVLQDTKLVLYAGNKFNKSKLDSAKNRAIIGKIFAETGIGDVDLETLPNPAPPKNEQAAKIAAMMGGGEEIDV